MELKIQREFHSNYTSFALSGEVDTYTSPGLKDELFKAVDARQANLIVDLSDVGYMDSSGLGIFVSAFRRVKEVGGKILLVITPDTVVSNSFRITGLDKVFSIHPTMDEATQALNET